MAAPVRSVPAVARRSVAGRAWTWVRVHVVVFAAAVALAYLFVPVLVVLAFSFNQPVGRFNYVWRGFSLDAWRGLCDVAGVCDSVLLSLRLATAATVLATVLGTLVAFAVTRYRFRGRGMVNVLVFLPIAMPEVVMGSSLLALFVQGGVDRGFVTLFVAHVLLCLSFVVVTVKARLAGLDPLLEEAARDLYADPWQTFVTVTLPLVWPGIVAAALLSFALSFDDFVVSNFNAGPDTVTFPMYVFGASQRGIPPQVNAVGTVMLLLALGVVLVAQLRPSARTHRCRGSASGRLGVRSARARR
ncbi:MAG TPA: ABC transporter permease [Cryptosporangiaceae bacterium]|nr:ABC transporter permease [Cryptosporangiaceae bacterium]